MNINNNLTAIFIGAILGAINGFIIRILLKKNIEKSNKKFFLIYFFSLFYKLFLLISSLLILNFKKDIMMILYSISLIFFLIVFELKPVKK
jgi:hypothetical protein